jgi:plasmid maintenance system antidote protein VapI
MPKPTPPMTAELAAKALTLVKVFKLKQHQAAAVLGVNQGRINEVIKGKRFVGVSPWPADQLCFDF